MTKPRKRPEDFRSHRWYGVNDLRSFGHRSKTKQMGFASEDYSGKPVIGIFNTWSDLNPCHSHFKLRVEEVKRGVWQAGGYPVELPALSLPENFMKPSTMLYRNLLAMETEEQLRSLPVDGAVLMGGCDKTTPALIMAATTVNLPSIFLPAGPMLRGAWRGKKLGSGSDVWKYWSEMRTGGIDDATWLELEDGIARSVGQCMTMGTASTMTSAAEALGFTLPGASSIPAADSAHARMASACGRRIVDMVWEDLTPRDFLTRNSFENAITTTAAMGGSTNAIIHLVAMARRAGIDLPLELFDAISRRVPMLCDIQPSGKYLMEDFYLAGGLRPLLERIRESLHLEEITVTGLPLGEVIAGTTIYDDDVIRPLDNPVSLEGGLAVLRGNLAPDGCVIKQTAASPHLLVHTGKAVVFRDVDDMKSRIDDDDLEVDADSVLILQNSGPLGGPGMPEWGMLPIPKKLLARGVTDMVRISDARMSGTSYGTCVLHVAPESFIGGPLGLVQEGDLITLDVPARSLNVHLDEDELAARRAGWVAPLPLYPRGFGALYSKHVTQADAGCDFDFLQDGPVIPDPRIY